MQDPKNREKIAIWHHHATLPGYIFGTKAHINNRKKNVKQQYLPHTSPQYGALRPTSCWDRFVRLGHLYKFQRVSRLGSVTAWYSSSGHQPNFATLNRGHRHHLYSAGRPSRWALAHILVLYSTHSRETTCRPENCLRRNSNGSRHQFMFKSLKNLVRNFIRRPLVSVRRNSHNVRSHKLPLWLALQSKYIVHIPTSVLTAAFQETGVGQFPLDFFLELFQTRALGDK